MQGQGKSGFSKIALLSGGLGSVVLIAVAVGAALSFRQPSGPPLVTADIRSGEPFALRFTSNGEEPRVWLDMECDSCSFPVTGEIALVANDKTFASNEVSAGDSRDRAWGGSSRSLEDHLVFDGPAQPAGTEVSVQGTLRVGPAKDTWNKPIESAPPPTVKVFRLAVTP